MNFGNLFIAGLWAALSAQAAATWTSEASGTTQALRAVDCTGELCAIAGDSGRVMIRAGRLEGWSVHFRTTPAGYRDRLPFVAVTDSYVVAAGYPSLHSTPDQGMSWNSYTLAPNGNGTLAAMHFTQGRGFLSYRVATCARSCSGLSMIFTALSPDWVRWRSQENLVKSSESLDLSPTAIHFVDSLTGYVAHAGEVMRTRNGAYPWTSHPLTGTPRALDFVGARIGFAAGDSGRIHRTTDSGSTWMPVNSGVTRRLNAIRFADSLTGYAVGDGGTILVTGDGGQSWASMNSGTTANLLSVTLEGDGSRGYAVGEGGILLRLTGGTPASLAGAMPGASLGARALRRKSVLLTLPDGRIFDVQGRHQ